MKCFFIQIEIILMNANKNCNLPFKEKAGKLLFNNCIFLRKSAVAAVE